jgi:hypothetical protein
MMILSCVVNKADADGVCICVLLVGCWVHLIIWGGIHNSLSIWHLYKLDLSVYWTNYIRVVSTI